ncbi:hypothetical protein P154DRAFT_578577 [Amniculicola lignicola CBS 123094]|uniref:Uncharacterized protein n=1 Tax=Amniculicola lignicola CBS 123094 TaxID=1392246 RepID=A0A6A5W7C8_9PLEO|nr:hypothetical protein P154DRAFT_578577 [Amniculicola lignicola CBS 123094]
MANRRRTRREASSGQRQLWTASALDTTMDHTMPTIMESVESDEAETSGGNSGGNTRKRVDKGKARSHPTPAQARTIPRADMVRGLSRQPVPNVLQLETQRRQVSSPLVEDRRQPRAATVACLGRRSSRAGRIRCAQEPTKQRPYRLGDEDVTRIVQSIVQRIPTCNGSGHDTPPMSMEAMQDMITEICRVSNEAQNAHIEAMLAAAFQGQLSAADHESGLATLVSEIRREGISTRAHVSDEAEGVRKVVHDRSWEPARKLDETLAAVVHRHDESQARLEIAGDLLARLTQYTETSMGLLSGQLREHHLGSLTSIAHHVGSLKTTVDMLGASVQEIVVAAQTAQPAPAATERVHASASEFDTQMQSLSTRMQDMRISTATSDQSILIAQMLSVLQGEVLLVRQNVQDSIRDADEATRQRVDTLQEFVDRMDQSFQGVNRHLSHLVEVMDELAGEGADPSRSGRVHTALMNARTAVIQHGDDGVVKVQESLQEMEIRIGDEIRGLRGLLDVEHALPLPDRQHGLDGETLEKLGFLQEQLAHKEACLQHAQESHNATRASLAAVQSLRNTNQAETAELERDVVSLRRELEQLQASHTGLITENARLGVLLREKEADYCVLMEWKERLKPYLGEVLYADAVGAQSMLVMR